ncbi:hypothetical protein FQN55_001572 [Onygenales sp. PD_40]|nr:hypothetical protein FQN55_001572 [Onygenales sp. PD_40]
MSTFDGIVEEFPQIRIDYFRKNPDRPAPQACFLSHVHSDHLQGLESLRSPFIYCSAATREILLRLEKYPHRLNFSKGILESRKKHYKHLAKLLRPIPLQVPTEIELSPRNSIRVTLFDANHCPGAVMFLIEGNGKAILYTGDIRAEAWWVDNLVRNPVLIPYTLGNKRLDKVYLDTTFATKSNVYQSFPSKAEGIRELLEKIKLYPEDTTFYLRVWTFGYEDVWHALSSALNTKIHVDRYQMGLYKSLATRVTNGFGVDEAPFLCGFTLGNTHVPGCLTHDQSARIHSCEPGMLCSTISKGPSVYITPIVTRRDDGSDVPEIGAGGGKGDLYQTHELELTDDITFQQLAKLCSERIQDEQIRASTIAALSEAYKSKSKSLSLDAYGIKEEDEISLQQFVSMLSRGPPDQSSNTPRSKIPNKLGRDKSLHPLSNAIHFPYSRHSSYAELCLLLQAFRPKDVFPCTVDATTWNEKVSIRSLFGHLCSNTTFCHDQFMRETIRPRDGDDEDDYRPQKRARRESDSSSVMLSTQRTDSDMIVVQDVELPSVIPGTAVNDYDDDDDDYPGGEQRPPSPAAPDLEIRPQGNSSQAEDGLPLPVVSQTTTTATTASQGENETESEDAHSSLNSKVTAIRAALKEQHRNHELTFHLPSSFSEIEYDYSSQSTSQSQPQPPVHAQAPSPPKSKPKPPQHPPPTSSTTTTTTTHPHQSQETPIPHNPSPSSASSSSDSISLPTSAFDSQQTNPPTTSTTTTKTNQTRTARIEAYLAARRGTYEAWSSVYGSMSTLGGNGHSEEEVEL